ncbi:major facilitator superfamily protein [Aspergillus aculeatinus CBS 121060]|uniref:Major facilitator superfamily protein n=1 Tax=Aspergillus aculeatinus CBS 121060 TaxID=1448322 RepID=A0ACD1GZM0_9EURO|nr:major facilitator superfamily protein [Aspergillus aculeatinus CBS 121060]RAH66743.1 major facilitator superfamily protein [Aspergillus aculeatinus CBS 121060]
MASDSKPRTQDPPNGGCRAWLQVVGSFFLFFNTWGLINSYGVFETFYEETLLQGTPSSTISWIGSLQSFLIMFLGVLTGPIYDAGFVIPLLYIGSFLVVFGHMMLSLCHSFWQVLLAQSFCVGIGAGLIFVPSIAILSTYFTTKLPLVIGIAASGSSIGGVIYPILIRELLGRVGFGWTIRVAGFVALFGLGISCAVLRVRVLPASRRKLIDWPAFREAPYTLFVIGLFLCFMGLYTPFYYLQSVAIQNHLTSEHLAFYLVPIMNATSTLGRLAPGYLSQWIGSLNILILCALSSGLLVLCIIAVQTQGSLLAICALYGFFSGSLVSLMGPILVMLSPHRGVTGTRMGMCFTLLGVALLIGTPIAGSILGSHGANMVWVYSGVLTLSGGATIGAARMRLTAGRPGIVAKA